MPRFAMSKRAATAARNLFILAATAATIYGAGADNDPLMFAGAFAALPILRQMTKGGAK